MNYTGYVNALLACVVGSISAYGIYRANRAAFDITREKLQQHNIDSVRDELKEEQGKFCYTMTSLGRNLAIMKHRCKTGIYSSLSV